MNCVKGCKFVDEVISGVPYVMNEEYIKYIIEKHNIDYIVHGDDPCIVDGKDVYEAAQKLGICLVELVVLLNYPFVQIGKYLTIPRTEGISTTDIVGRILLMSRAHHNKEDSDATDGKLSSQSNELRFAYYFRCYFCRKCVDSEVFEGNRSHFLTTSRTIRLFGAGLKVSHSRQKIIYNNIITCSILKGSE
jgi:ethanolamine-phosphate cytidylyltransferase